MRGKDRYRVSATVKSAEKYFATHLMADAEFEITVQGFTTTGSGPPSRRIARTNKVPAVTGMFSPTLKITILNTVPSASATSPEFGATFNVLQQLLQIPLLGLQTSELIKSQRLINKQSQRHYIYFSPPKRKIYWFYVF